MVRQGKDYDKVAGWLLRLPPHLLHHTSALTLWLGGWVCRRGGHEVGGLAATAAASPVAPRIGSNSVARCVWV